MTSNIKLNKTIRHKEESRKIVKEIINYGVTDDQKLDIMFMLAMNLEDNDMMKKITKFLKNHITTINKEENIENNNKILLT